LSGKSNHEKDAIAANVVAIFRNPLSERIKPNTPGIKRGPLTTRKSAKSGAIELDID
jgi:hypothetical protein